MSVSWRQKTAEPVTIRLADIVSGKPVPPRPSPRLRVSPRQAQLHGFALFPDLVVSPLAGPSGWLLRSSATATARRANSVLAFPGGSFGPSDVAAVEAHYAALGKPAVAAVLGDSEERSFLAGLGWVPRATTPTRSSSSRRWRPYDAPCGRLTTLPWSWRSTVATATATIPGVAQGFAAYADDWVGFRGIEVAPAHRRRGLGRAIMAALLEWGAELGATTAYLQVLGHNEPALALYDSMGFHDPPRLRLPDARSSIAEGASAVDLSHLVSQIYGVIGLAGLGTLARVALSLTPVRPDNPRDNRVRASGVPTRGR